MITASETSHVRHGLLRIFWVYTQKIQITNQAELRAKLSILRLSCFSIADAFNFWECG